MAEKIETGMLMPTLHRTTGKCNSTGHYSLLFDGVRYRAQSADRGGLDLAIRFRYLSIDRGQCMYARLIIAACITGVMTFSLQEGLAAAENRTAKPESVPSTSLKS